MAEDTDDGVKLSTGREIYAHAGIIGISPELEVTYGYDGSIYDPESGLNEDFTRRELLELADHAIERWLRFKHRVAEGK